MKKTLTAAVALAGSLGYAGAANAVDVNPDGIGQVLLYSYYTVENGNDTLINITNTTSREPNCTPIKINTSNFSTEGSRPCWSGVKAVKVRFLEAMNSQEVLDFNLYLSPHDVWTGAISRTEDGAKLSTADKSCTVPAIPAGGVEFRNFQYEGDDYSDGRGGPQGLDRTRSGYIEVIEMGNVLDVDYSSPSGGYFSIADWATHVNGVPPLCAGLSILWAPTASDKSNIWTTTKGTFSMTGPTGGLYGSAVIVNVEGGTDVAYDAVAIEEFNYNLIHTNPGDLLPSLNQAMPEAVLPDGQYFEVAPFRPNVDAVSAVLTKASIMNDYLTVAALAASTDWVVTFPTKRFYVNGWLDAWQGSYSGSAPYRAQTNVTTGDAAPDYEHVPGQQDAVWGLGSDRDDWVGPFREWWTDKPNGGVEGSACEQISIEYWDQEEGSPRTPPGQIDFSPQPPPTSVPGNYLCYEANVISVNGSDILGSPYTRAELNLADGWDAGWIRISFDNDFVHKVPGFRYSDGPEYWDGEFAIIGLPVTGFAVQAFVNGDVGGLLSNYAGLTVHKAEREYDFSLDCPFDSQENGYCYVPVGGPI